jgi:hypothetical protein
MMPKATAVWLVDNTTLTFDQVAEFCGLHPLEVQAIADGEVAVGMAGHDPIANDQLTAEEIARCEKDPKAKLKLLESDMPMPTTRAKGARYTPVSKRQDKPDGIAWLLRTFPELSDAQIGKLLGTTKPTITAIRDRTHWNAPNIRPRDPVDLGLCARGELDEAVQKARRRATRRAKDAAREARKAGIAPPEAADVPGAPAAAPADQVMGSAHAAPEPAYAPAPEPTAPAAPEPVATSAPEPTAADVFKTPERAAEPAPADDGPDNPVLDPNLLFKPKPAAPEGEAAEKDEEEAEGQEKQNP